MHPDVLHGESGHDRARYDSGLDSLNGIEVR
jgi:hypothetical protein